MFSQDLGLLNCGCLAVQGLSRSIVDQAGFIVDGGLAVGGQFCSPGQELT